MTAGDPANRRGNLFASVLEEILRAHGLRLGLLDDRVGIHPQKVARLQRPTREVRRFSVLNPDELDAVIYTFHLSEREIVRLRAAILATAMESMLKDRFDREEDARQALQQIAPIIEQQILPIIEEALMTHAREGQGLALVRGEATSLWDADEESDSPFGQALATIDRATLALHLSHNARSHQERLLRAREARDAFALALGELEASAAPRTEAWRLWHDEAQHGVDTASQRLRLLGADA